MRLSTEQIKQAILHPDQRVREFAVHYFSRGLSTDPSIPAMVIQAIEKYGLDKAFQSYEFADRLQFSADTVAWVVSQLKLLNELYLDNAAGVDEDVDDFGTPFSSHLVGYLERIHPSLLEKYAQELAELDVVMFYSAEISLLERVQLDTSDVEGLWTELVEICEDVETYEELGIDEAARAKILAEAIGRCPDVFNERVLSALNDEQDPPNALKHMVARIAGDLRIEAAIPALVSLLNLRSAVELPDEEGENEDEEEEYAELHLVAHRSLVQIGGDAVLREITARWSDCTPECRYEIAWILASIYSDASVETARKLSATEADVRIQSTLARSMLMNFETAAIEPARQIVLSSERTIEMIDLRSDLIDLCLLTGDRFAEYDEWLEDSKLDDEFRSQWYGDFDFMGSDEFPADEEEEEDQEFKELYRSTRRMLDPSSSIMPPIQMDLDGPEAPDRDVPFVHTERTVGRNDPCPCGSGKKFKKCCYGKNQQG